VLSIREADSTLSHSPLEFSLSTSEFYVECWRPAGN